jgi:hypothetical protein
MPKGLKIWAEGWDEIRSVGSRSGSGQIEKRTDRVRYRRHVIRVTVAKATDGVQEDLGPKDEGED